MYSFVIPVMNEEESLVHFYAELVKEIKKLELSYELLFIDDGSTDSSLTILKDLAKKDSHLKIFSFRTNQGKAEALTFGFQKSEGDIIMTLDADLQDQPSELVKFIEKQKEGVEVVCGWRKDRKDKSKMVVISRMFNAFTGTLFGLHLHDYNCGYKLYTKEAAKSLKLYGGLHRFIPLILYQQGFLVDEIPVSHVSRKYGKSKYGFSKIFKDLPDMFTMFFLIKYGSKPLHFFGSIGMFMITVGVLVLLYLSVIHFTGVAIGNRPLLLFGVLFLLSGLQIFFTGFLAELITNVSQRNKAATALKYTSESTI